MTWWQQVGIVCGSAVAALSLLILLAKGLRRVWRGLGKASRLVDSVAGDTEQGIPSLLAVVKEIRAEQVATRQELAAMKQQLDELTVWREWFDNPTKQQRPNGTGNRQTPRGR